MCLAGGAIDECMDNVSASDVRELIVLLGEALNVLDEDMASMRTD